MRGLQKREGKEGGRDGVGLRGKGEGGVLFVSV